MRVLSQDGWNVLNSDYINRVIVRKDEKKDIYKIIAIMNDEMVLMGEYNTENRCMTVLKEYFDEKDEFIFPPADQTDRDTALKKLKAMPIEKIRRSVSAHTYNCVMRIHQLNLKYLKMDTIGDLLVAKNEDLLRIRSLGQKTLDELNELQRRINKASVWWLENIDFPERYNTEQGKLEMEKEMKI